MAPSSLEALSVPRGSWLLELRAPGRVSATLAVDVDRPQNIAIRLRLPTDAELMDGFVLVPAGPWTRGGDAGALNSQERSGQWSESFAIACHPVTVAEFGAFLADVGNRAGHGCWTGPEALPDAERQRLPALGVSFDAAVAYAEWASVQRGFSLCLPTHDQWEKAARGADGRVYPWGHSASVSQ